APAAAAASLRGFGRAGKAGARRLALPRAPWLVAAVVLVALGMLAWVRRDDLARWRSFLPAEVRVLRVGPGSGFATIAAALEAARWGHVVEVEPGTYDERIELEDGVTLRSRVPGAAVLRPTREGSLEEMVAVRAVGVEGARLEGFRIAGAEDGSLDVGLLLIDSTVQAENVEIHGASGTAVRFGGGDRSSLLYSHLHENPGRAMLVESAAAPKIVHNLVRGNGGGGGAGASALEVTGQGSPIVVGNRFIANAGLAVRVPTRLIADAIAAQNSFEPEDAERTVEAALGGGDS
ncbi:MAG TPA: right-handed parallel beta-helix repeat-containing protein, partial [Thermoanaerobaculia bacterium]|nr:right-handed parallel beta-helix repeat-containing protein [Thermoanaerobaculia bacterium]